MAFKLHRSRTLLLMVPVGLLSSCAIGIVGNCKEQAAKKIPSINVTKSESHSTRQLKLALGDYREKADHIVEVYYEDPENPHAHCTCLYENGKFLGFYDDLVYPGSKPDTTSSDSSDSKE